MSIDAAALGPGEDWQSWLARADAARYRAKADGRNRTVIDQPAAAIGPARVVADRA